MELPTAPVLSVAHFPQPSEAAARRFGVDFETVLDLQLCWSGSKARSCSGMEYDTVILVQIAPFLFPIFLFMSRIKSARVAIDYAFRSQQPSTKSTDNYAV